MQGGGVALIPDTAMKKSVQWRREQHVCQHTTSDTRYRPTTWEAKLIVMTTQCALRANDIHHLALGHGNAHTHTRTHTHSATLLLKDLI